MSRSVLPLLALILLVPDAGSAPRPKDRPKVVEELVGEWEAVSLKTANTHVQFVKGMGHRFSFAESGKLVVTIAGQARARGSGGTTPAAGLIRVRSTSPRRCTGPD